MLKKLEHPSVWGILFACFFAGFGFAVGEAVQRVNDAAALNAVHHPQNILELALEYFDPRVMLFTAVFVILAAIEADFFFHQSRLERRLMQAAVKEAAMAREAANEKTVLLARLNEHGFEPELFASVTNALNEP
jgi:hypothetical protein